MGNIHEAIAALVGLEKRQRSLIAVFDLCGELCGVDGRQRFHQVESLEGIKGNDEWQVSATDVIGFGGGHEPRPEILTAYYKLSEDESPEENKAIYPIMYTNTGHIVQLAV
jgi:hypothetical protein